MPTASSGAHPQTIRSNSPPLVRGATGARPPCTVREAFGSTLPVPPQEAGILGALSRLFRTPLAAVGSTPVVLIPRAHGHGEGGLLVRAARFIVPAAWRDGRQRVIARGNAGAIGRDTVLATTLPGIALRRERMSARMTRIAASANGFFRTLPHRVLEPGSRFGI